MFRKIKIILGVVITLSIIFSSFLYAKDKGKYERYKTRYYDTYYRSPTWLDNERIIFVKYVFYNRRYLLPIVEEFYTVRADYCICSMKTDGTDEETIKQFTTIYDKHGEVVKEVVMIEDGKEIPVKEAICPFDIDCSPKAGLIAFSEKDNIYIMKTDGSDLTKIAKGGGPRFSPDGTKILYRRKDGPHIMNSDGTNKYKVIDEGALGISAIWYPDGKRIYFFYSDVKVKDSSLYVINIDGTGKEKFIETGVWIEDWSPDGSRFIAGRSMYTAEGKNIWNDYLGTHSSNPKRYCIPNNARFSPDGTKIVGHSTYEPWGEIAILSSDFISIKVLRRNE